MEEIPSPGNRSPAAHGDPPLSIDEVQGRILEQLQAARAVLTARSGSGALPKDELAEVLEELSHSTALMAKVKHELDGMFGRLRRTRAALAAAFPQHAVAPRPVVGHEEGAAAAEVRQQLQRHQPQEGSHDGPQEEAQGLEAGQRQAGGRQEEDPGQRRQSDVHLEQGGAAAEGLEAPGPAAEGGQAAEQPAPTQPDVAGKQQAPEA